jgi:DoxX-like family
MWIAYLVVSIITAIANIYAAANDFIRPEWLLANMTKLGVHESWLRKLGFLKAAGALGVLVGFRMPLIGGVAAVGLVLFFVGAIITHLRSRDYNSLAMPIGFLLLAIATLTLEVYARGPIAFAVLVR